MTAGAVLDVKADRRQMASRAIAVRDIT